MNKHRYNQEKFIEDDIDARENYEDDHLEEFCRLVIEELFSRVKNIPFERIINDQLKFDKPTCRTERANFLCWLMTADRITIGSWTVYSFRFANACHSDLYKTFETKTYHLFQPSTSNRHDLAGWHKYTGRELLKQVDKCVNIARVVQGQNHHRTKLYVNQKEERLDIEFNFDTTDERITITFEPGYPAIE